MAGALLPGSWYVKAQRFRRQYRAEVLKLFDEVDIVLAPATPCSAPKLGQVMMTLGGVELPVRANLGLFTQPISFIGLPVVAVPTRKPGAMPIGVQVIARPTTRRRRCGSRRFSRSKASASRRRLRNSNAIAFLPFAESAKGRWPRHRGRRGHEQRDWCS